MRFLHTADWHIGQLFYEYDRTFEHQQFLNWLLETLKTEQIDVLLICGDVFDLSNPSAIAIRLFYTFLNDASTYNPDLQIIIISGNHDSAARLEAPKPLLLSKNIQIIGNIARSENGDIDYEPLCIPIKNKDNQVEVWCLAIPFLRLGDYPPVNDAQNAYTEGVAAFYQQAYQFAVSKRSKNEAIIALGHLHAHHAETSDLDSKERQIMGGVEGVPSSAFHKDLTYVALGHIHKAQRIGNRENVRYSGSPIPMSFTEINYKHQVTVFNILDNVLVDIQVLEVPKSIPLIRIPAKHEPLNLVLDKLVQYQDTTSNSALAPYLEVRVLLEGPEPSLKYQIEKALQNKNLRLARIDHKIANQLNEEKEEFIEEENLEQLQPINLLEKIYLNAYGNELPETLNKLFLQVIHELNEQETI